MPPSDRWRVISLVASFSLQEQCLSKWKTFMEANEVHFQPLDDPSEYSLQQSEVHAAFEDLVQSQIGEFLASIGESMSTFAGLLKAGKIDSGDDEQPTDEVRAQCEVFIQLLVGCVEFRAFADIMRDKSKRAYYFQILEMWRRSLK